MNVKKLLSNNFKEITDDAVKIIRNGGIIIVPFDTVYGLICDPKNDIAVRKIFELKKRPLDKTIGLCTTSIPALETFAEINHEDFIKSHIFGPYTFVLNVKTDDFSKLCVRDGTVAVRIPNSELILNIAKHSNLVIAQTSANLSGRPTCDSVEEIKAQFKPEELEQVDLIIDWGEIEKSAPSKIFDLTGTQPVEINR
ncbi:MAG: L-threonylcarbamoyladenylate synthase [bacterium]|nr:L-threonylcarbamoyladenylate synthase [bacterium]